ncbi:MAG: hypothetical protein M1817_001376 [Caeruleum heppii]|nr:MAG: hypothetical protein M1817_001376 [Caeruleum heppii]
MCKRKHLSEKAGAHPGQEPSTSPPSPLRKSAPLSERDSHQPSPAPKIEQQRSEQCREFLSPSTIESTREDVSRDYSTLAIAYLPQRRPIQLSENNSEKSTNGTSFESHFGKTHSAPFGWRAGSKRKHEKELGQASIESRKRRRKSEPAAASPDLDPKELLELPGDGLSEEQKVQFEEVVPRTSVPVIESPERPAKEHEARELGHKESHNPISYWAAHRTWPEDFAEHNPMASSNSVNKRQRTADGSQIGKDERSRSYSQSRKDGKVPQQYTAAYEEHIVAKGLDMNHRKGRDLVSEESQKTCANFLRIDVDTIGPTAVPQNKIGDIVDNCKNRNEAMVHRDITSLIIPSLRLLYHCGASNLEHVVDEVNADWYDQCVLEGPRLRPDLAIGLFSAAFTEGEIDKLKRYTSVDNWTQVTMRMFFPFLMCEVKCGREGLDQADRQNMHSCSVAVRTLLRIEQEADKYRPEKEMERKTDSLSGQVLVFSISHDQQDARLYGHYATVQGEKWTYYRYPIRKFDLTDNNDLLVIHNFVRNILRSHLPGHLRRLKDALAAFPDPNEQPISSGLPSSSGLSFAASGIALDNDRSQQDSQVRDADGFVVPPRPDSSQNSGGKRKEQESRLIERIDKLMLQIEEERRQRQKSEELRQQDKEEVERQRQKSEELRQEMERQRQKSEELRQEDKEEVERQRQKSEELRQEMERQRQKSEEMMDKLSQRLLGGAAD